MDDKRLYRVISTLLLLVIISMGYGIWFIYRQFSYLDNHNDTHLVSESLKADYALSLCLVTVIHRQTLYTTQSDGVIWQRAAKQWQNGDNRIYGSGGEAQLQRDSLPFVTIGSRLFFHSDRPHNVIFVNNQLTVQLSDWLCHFSE